MNDGETSNKRQKSVLGPEEDTPDSPPMLMLRRQDTRDDMDSVVQVADAWSQNAREYLDLAKKVPIVQYFSDYAADLLIASSSAHLSTGHTFLDVCAGPGTYALAVASKLGHEKTSGLEIIITDFSAGMIDAAKTAVAEAIPSATNVKYEVVDVQNISLPTNTADVVGCMFGYFVPDRPKAWSEVCRVCKPGGIAVIGTWQYAGFAYVLDDFLKFLGRTEPYNAMVMAHTCADVQSLKAEVAGGGFADVTVHEHGKVFDMPQTNELVMALFHNPMIKQELVSYAPEHILGEWRAFLLANAGRLGYDAATNILPIQYTANVVIARK